MARNNSPPHPSMSLSKSISAVEKIFAADRRNPVDREVAAKHIGYTGKSGASDKALASLAHFGLVEKVGKGSVRVSQLAMDILHPDPSDQQGKDRALLEAGMNPQIFKELRAQFPDHVSESTLRSYLVRIGFNDTALPAAMNAYTETLRFLEQSKVFESGGHGGQSEQESDLQENDAGADMTDATTLERPGSPARRYAAAPTNYLDSPAEEVLAQLNRINMNIQGDKVHLNGILDLKGLDALESKISALKILLAMNSEANGNDESKANE